jgi:hypothetical protein
LFLFAECIHLASHIIGSWFYHHVPSFSHIFNICSYRLIQFEENFAIDFVLKYPMSIHFRDTQKEFLSLMRNVPSARARSGMIAVEIFWGNIHFFFWRKNCFCGKNVWTTEKDNQLLIYLIWTIYGGF